MSRGNKYGSFMHKRIIEQVNGLEQRPSWLIKSVNRWIRVKDHVKNLQNRVRNEGLERRTMRTDVMDIT